MINTRASINKAVEALNLGIPVEFEDNQAIEPGAGAYPSVFIRVLSDERQRPAHFGRLAPGATTGGVHREALVLEAEVRSRSTTWNEADYYAGLLRDGLSERTLTRKIWLLDADSINPAPVTAGLIRMGVARVDHVEDDQQPQFRSAVVTWADIEVEVPA